MMEEPNLSYIDQLSGGDERFRQKLINIIKSEFPIEKEEYLNNFETKKYVIAAANVHKLKHKISILGLEKSYKIAEDYEDNLKENNTMLSKEFSDILNSMSTFLETL